MKLPFALLGALLMTAAFAVVPEHSVENGVVKIKGAGPDNPIIYDNDF